MLIHFLCVRCNNFFSRWSFQLSRRIFFLNSGIDNNFVSRTGYASHSQCCATSSEDQPQRRFSCGQRLIPLSLKLCHYTIVSSAVEVMTGFTGALAVPVKIGSPVLAFTPAGFYWQLPVGFVDMLSFRCSVTTINVSAFVHLATMT